MCDRWAQTNGDIEREQKLKIVRDLAASGVWWLSISGGEPFVDPDLGAVISAAKEHGLFVKVTTNGSLLQENLDIIRRLDYLIVSVDSHVNETHDALRGMPGLFDKIVAGISAVKKLDKSPETAVRLLVTKTNIGTIEEYLQFWRGKVDRIYFQPIHESAKLNWHIPKGSSDVLLQPQDRARYYAVLKKYGLYTTFNKGIFDYLVKKEDLAGAFRCFCGHFFLHIDPTGTLWNCPGRTLELGDLQQAGIAELARRNTQAIKRFAENRPCVCWLHCVNMNLGLGKVFR
jgi:MoaA/NifB/PqqE/SkfB family radical SAM enzyme